MSNKPCIDSNESIYSSLNFGDYVDKCLNEQYDSLFDEDDERDLDMLGHEEYEKAYLESFKSSS